MPPVPGLCLHQPFPAISKSIQLVFPPRRPHYDPFTPLWRDLEASTHLTSLSFLGSFALLVPRAIATSTRPTIPKLQSKRHACNNQYSCVESSQHLDCEQTVCQLEKATDEIPFLPNALGPDIGRVGAAGSEQIGGKDEPLLSQEPVPTLKPQVAMAGHACRPQFLSALTSLSATLRSLTFQNAPLSWQLCEAIAQLQQLTHLDMSSSRMLTMSSDTEMPAGPRPDCRAWCRWHVQGSMHPVPQCPLPCTILFCGSLSLGNLKALRELSVRGQAGIQPQAVDMLTQLKSLTALDLAHSARFGEYTLLQV